RKLRPYCALRINYQINVDWYSPMGRTLAVSYGMLPPSIKMLGRQRPSRAPIAAEMQNHANMVQSACGEPRRSLPDKHEEGSDEKTRFHQSEHSGTCSRHDSCRCQRDGSGKHRE